MIYLLLCILSSAGIMVIFKIAGIRRLDTFKIIVINYFTASLLGISIAGRPEESILSSEWFTMAVTIGILFIIMFFVIALSTQKAGIAVTSVATKMSVVLPITFSIIYFRESVYPLKIAGIFLALISVFMTTYNREKANRKGFEVIMLPLIIFLGSGLIDSLIKFTQEVKLMEEKTILFSTVLFSISALTGLIISFFRKGVLKTQKPFEVLTTGIVLGIVNFGSLYGIIMALGSGIFDSSIIFGINNIGIVVVSVLTALLFFGEKLSHLNKAGIILSIITIILLSFL